MEPLQGLVVIMGAVGAIFTAFGIYAQSRVRHFAKLAEQERAKAGGETADT